MFLLKLCFPSDNCMRKKSVVTLLVNISLNGVLYKESQAPKANSFMGCSQYEHFVYCRCHCSLSSLKMKTLHDGSPSGLQEALSLKSGLSDY